jgi:NADH-quinone oxidoreductase subunit F
VLTAEEAMKATMDYECLAQMGSMLGSGAIIVMDDSNSMVDMLDVIMHFYAHESCGQCTPCREGTGWLSKIMHRIANGHGEPKDIDLLKTVSERMMGKTICALSDAAAMPAISFATKFRSEFEAYIQKSQTASGSAAHA